MAFISIQEASERTGMSMPTITRLARKNEHTTHVKREDRKFFIEDAFLFSQYPEVKMGDESTTNHDESEQKPKEAVESRTFENAMLFKIVEEAAERDRASSQRLIERLEDENRHLKHQLDKKDTQIANFQERERELHHLLNNQTRLLEGMQEVQQQPEQQASATGQQREATDSNNNQQVKNRTETDTLKKEATDSNTLIWVALGAVVFLLLLSILFVDELRALAE